MNYFGAQDTSHSRYLLLFKLFIGIYIRFFPLLPVETAIFTQTSLVYGSVAKTHIFILCGRGFADCPGCVVLQTPWGLLCWSPFVVAVVLYEPLKYLLQEADSSGHLRMPPVLCGFGL